MNDEEHSSGGLHVDVQPYTDLTVLHLTGHLSGATAPMLHVLLAKALAARVPPVVIVDARGLSVIDPSGWAILDAADRHARDSGGRVIVTGGGNRLVTSPAPREIM
ncbi:STAS domain-containing protein [Planobispora longispora]|uniref:STAS domain-containing protein n=1 Tax=Planobispora longispora TaxID=28887 RepID=A0A8J3RFI8_9ACTN|nr:STAS domain-containing protein [Planobispora longispora]GIH73904.1 hypothetical protein Plo01_03330 [Planobispora longispora]